MAARSDSASRRAEQRQQLPEEVARHVRELIISGAIREGEFLRMDRIAEDAGVSNTPVREGLLALRSEGFVRLEPRRGFVVAPFTREDVRDLFWAQSVLAGELAARAALNATPEQLTRLAALTKEYEAAVAADDIDAIADLGTGFHREINLMADSPRLARLLGSIVRALSIRYYATLERQVNATLGEHPAIVRSMRARNAERTRTLMERHVMSGAVWLIDSLERRGMWSDDARQLSPAAKTSRKARPATTDAPTPATPAKPAKSRSKGAAGAGTGTRTRAARS